MECRLHVATGRAQLRILSFLSTESGVFCTFAVLSGCYCFLCLLAPRSDLMDGLAPYHKKSLEAFGLL